MKTPDTRPRFQAPKRHYHRSRVENPHAGWESWIGHPKKERKLAPGIWRIAGWLGALLAFAGLIVLMCYQLL